MFHNTIEIFNYFKHPFCNLHWWITMEWTSIIYYVHTHAQSHIHT